MTKFQKCILTTVYNLRSRIENFGDLRNHKRDDGAVRDEFDLSLDTPADLVFSKTKM